MTGNGTQTDPYIPVTWEEFIIAIGTIGAYVSLPEGGGTFDMNDIVPEGGLNLNLNCVEIKGNDWNINNARNMYIESQSSNTRNIYNLNFLNVYKDSDRVMFKLKSDDSFYNCKFSGIIEGEPLIYYGKCHSCSFNFQCYGQEDSIGSGSSYGDTYFYYSRIRLDLSGNTADKIYVDYAQRFYNSLLEHFSIGEKQVDYQNFKGNTSILHSEAGSCILLPDGSKVNVTEEQVKDATYLRSVGFPIAGDLR